MLKTNTTAVPYDSYLHKMVSCVSRYPGRLFLIFDLLSPQFFVDPPGFVALELVAIVIAFWMGAWPSHLVRAVFMFRPSRVGGTICVILTLALITLCSVLWVQEAEYRNKNGEASPGNPAASVFPILILFFSPVIYLLAYTGARKQKIKHVSFLKAYFLFFGVLIIEVILKYFSLGLSCRILFLASTSTFIRFLTRMFGQIIVLKAGLEVSWQVSSFAAKNSKSCLHVTVASFGNYASMFPLLGRVMQGSAEALGKSILYEVAGTIAELLIAYQLLRSRTPVFHQI